MLHRLHGHSARIFAVGFSPDGTLLASGGENRSLWFWDTATGRETGRIDQAGGWVRSLVFLPGRKTLVAGVGFTLKLCDLPGQTLRLVRGSENFVVESLAVSPDGQTVAVAGGTLHPDRSMEEGQVRLYDVGGNSLKLRRTLTFVAEGPNLADRRRWACSDVAFTPDGQQVIGVVMTAIVTWDATTGEVRDYFERSMASSSDQLAISPNGRSAATLQMQMPSIVDIIPSLAPVH